MKLSNVVFFLSFSLLLSQSFGTQVRAGGGGDPNVVIGNTTQQTTSGIITNNGGNTLVQPTTPLSLPLQPSISPITNSPVQPLSIQPITPLQSTQSYFNSTTTQYGSNGYAPQCGLSVTGGVTNANTTLQQAYDARVTYNTNPCPNQNKIEEMRRKTQVQETKIYTTGNVLNTCIGARAQAVMSGKDPNLICTLPDMTQMKSLLDPEK
jgi:hypothetical protein